MLSLPCPAMAADALPIHDGDGLGTGKNRVRLWGVDAPELGQTCQRPGGSYRCGITARDALRQLVGTAPVDCREIDRDRYGRRVARCTVGGADLGALMVRSGWAVDYAEYSKGAYAAEQAEARAARRGLWAGRFELPADWRRNRRARRSS